VVLLLLLVVLVITTLTTRKTLWLLGMLPVMLRLLRDHAGIMLPVTEHLLLLTAGWVVLQMGRIYSLERMIGRNPWMVGRNPHPPTGRVHRAQLKISLSFSICIYI